jgi:hypothetical protein
MDLGGNNVGFSIAMKVIDKGLQGKGHKDPFIKLAADDGSRMKVMLESRSDLVRFDIEEIFIVKISQDQQKL